MTSLYAVQQRRDPQVRPKVVRILGAQDATDAARSGTVFVATSRRALDRLPAPLPRKLRATRLLAIDPVGPDRAESLRASFERVVASPGYRFLATSDMLAAMTAENAVDRLVGVLVSHETAELVLVRGDASTMAVPFAWFHPSPTGVAPDFDDVEVVDFGIGLRLGSYEAAVEAILYELDRDFRARERQRRIEMDPTFGAALRRLRIQKGVARSGFPGISEKEIARIERGEVSRPHAATLRAIADRLGVAPADIVTF
jgi:DNA-binding Xre family transcriptional regulator